MKNGDRITGEVKLLEGGILKVSLDYVDGTLFIDWLKVARIESNELFLVRLEDGTTYSAKVITPDSPTPVKIEIRPEDQPALLVDKTQVVRMAQTSETTMERFSGNISLGSTYSKGNNATQYNLGTELDYKETKWGGRVTQTSNLSSSTGATTATRNQIDMSLYRYLRWSNYYYAGYGGILQSSVQGIRPQTSLGFGLGKYLKNSNRFRLAAMAGMGWQRTRYITDESSSTQNIAVALLSSNMQFFAFKKTRLSVDGSVAPTVSQGGRYFSKLNAAYYLKLFGKVDWNMSFYGNWDSQPPATLSSSDYGTSMGLSWNFGAR